MNKSYKRMRYIKCLFLLVLGTLCIVTVVVGRQDNKSSNKQQPTERFDLLVREDFFAGMWGDKARLNRGMKYCEDMLAKNPKHAEALVWHGGGLLTRASMAYKAGDTALGDKLWQQGFDEMNKAREYEPENMGVKIGRAATIIGISQSGWDPTDKQARELLQSAVTDYEKVYEWQKPMFDKLDLHSRGELLFGLASGWSILGNQQKARFYLNLVIEKCRDSDYEKEAKSLLSENQQSTFDHNCVACHVAKSP